MSNEQSIRDEARAYIHKKRPEWHDSGVGIVQGSHYRSGFADGAEWALTDSPVIRRIQAEAGAEALRSYRTRLMDQHIDRFGIVLPDLHEVLDDLDERADRIERGETS